MSQVQFEAATLGADLTTTGAQDAHQLRGPHKAIQVKGSTSAGAGSATVYIEVSNDKLNWELMWETTLTLGTTEVSDGVAVSNAWKWIRVNVNAISGTGAKVSAYASA